MRDGFEKAEQKAHAKVAAQAVMDVFKKYGLHVDELTEVFKNKDFGLPLRTSNAPPTRGSGVGPLAGRSNSSVAGRVDQAFNPSTMGVYTGA